MGARSGKTARPMTARPNRAPTRQAGRFQAMADGKWRRRRRSRRRTGRSPFLSPGERDLKAPARRAARRRRRADQRPLFRVAGHADAMARRGARRSPAPGIRRNGKRPKPSMRSSRRSSPRRRERSLRDRLVFAGAPHVDVVARVQDIAFAVEPNRPQDSLDRFAVLERLGDGLRIVRAGALDPLGDRLNYAVAEQGEAFRVEIPEP